MELDTLNYINSLNRENIPWNRMFTAYGTAENYNELLAELEQITDIEQWKKTFSHISDFEHQSTMFPPAPFALVFLVRILEMRLKEGNADGIAENLIGQFLYYADVCNYAEWMEHGRPLESFSDLLDEGNLLPEDFTEEDLQRIYEDPDAVSEELFYSFYHYSKIVMSQVPDILDQYGKYPDLGKELRDMLM